MTQPIAAEVPPQAQDGNSISSSAVPLSEVAIDRKVGENSNTPRPKPFPFKRPDYHAIHSKPLPLEVFPLPAFIPHNPLSVVRIAIALISHCLRPPVCNQNVYMSYFSPETQSVHVTTSGSIRALWEQGFFGAGSLSRSEPRWLDQEKRKRGLAALQTSEERTKKVREDRRQFKLRRAKEQSEAREEQLRREGKSVQATTNIREAARSSSGHFDEALSTALPSSTELPESPLIEPGVIQAGQEDSRVLPRKVEEQDLDIQDQEHLQLTFEEAFFLYYALGALQVLHDDLPIRSSSILLRNFCQYSEFPPIEDMFSLRICPDNAFIIRYVVYHHFRSLGWVIRSGIKFAVDYLLYNRGPAFSHAEFGIMIIPAYSHSHWSETEERIADCKKKEHRDWWWLHRVNRVQTQVFKTLMLVYVDIPPPWDESANNEDDLDIGGILSRYKVREFMIRRWTPNRNRK